MASFIRLIEQFAIVLYAACLVGVVWSIRSAWLAWRERSSTLYSLERETAAARIGRAVLSGLAFVGLGAAIFFVASFVAPTLPTDEPPTPTPPGPLVTLTPTGTPVPTRTPETTATPEPSLNPTLIGGATTEPPTRQPTSIPLPSAQCPDPRVQISAPGNRQVFSSSFQVYGTANIENFGFYKFVVNGPATNFEERTTGEVVRTPVVNNYLGTLDLTILLEAPGTYRFSLVAVDNVGNEAPHCTISLQFLPATPAPD